MIIVYICCHPVMRVDFGDTNQLPHVLRVFKMQACPFGAF